MAPRPGLVKGVLPGGPGPGARPDRGRHLGRRRDRGDRQPARGRLARWRDNRTAAAWPGTGAARRRRAAGSRCRRPATATRNPPDRASCARSWKTAAGAPRSGAGQAAQPAWGGSPRGGFPGP